MNTDSATVDKSYLTMLQCDLESVVRDKCTRLSYDIRQQYDNVGDCDDAMINVYINYILYIFEYGVLQFDINMSSILYITHQHYITFLERVLSLIPAWIVTDEFRQIFDVHMRSALGQQGCYIEACMSQNSDCDLSKALAVCVE